LVTVTNEGERAGSTVVQLYVGDSEASVPRPAKELKAFAKLALAPGESRTVSLDVVDRDFAFYAVAARHWKVEPGTFTLFVGTSAEDIAFTGEVSRKTALLLPV
jgi:beta-glucosidase